MVKQNYLFTPSKTGGLKQHFVATMNLANEKDLKQQQQAKNTKKEKQANKWKEIGFKKGDILIKGVF